MKGTKQAEWLLNYLKEGYPGVKQLLRFADWLVDKLEEIVDRV